MDLPEITTEADKTALERWLRFSLTGDVAHANETNPHISYRSLSGPVKEFIGSLVVRLCKKYPEHDDRLTYGFVIWSFGMDCPHSPLAPEDAFYGRRFPAHTDLRTLKTEWMCHNCGALVSTDVREEAGFYRMRLRWEKEPRHRIFAEATT